MWALNTCNLQKTYIYSCMYTCMSASKLFYAPSCVDSQTNKIHTQTYTHTDTPRRTNNLSHAPLCVNSHSNKTQTYTTTHLHTISHDSFCGELFSFLIPTKYTHTYTHTHCTHTRYTHATLHTHTHHIPRSLLRRVVLLAHPNTYIHTHTTLHYTTLHYIHTHIRTISHDPFCGELFSLHIPTTSTGV
jgi:hypothetical protein